MSDLFVSGYEKRFGCLWINNITEGVVTDFEGYACEFGKEPYQVKNLGDVSKKVIWWSNIPQPACWSYGRFKTLKPNEYMGLSLNQLIMSYCEDQEDIKNHLYKFADIFKRFYYFISEKFYKGQHFDMSDGCIADHFLLSRNKKETDLYEDKITLEQQEIANRSFLTIFKSKDFTLDKDKKRLTFYLPMAPFIKSMKNIDIPNGNWEVLNISTERADVIDILKDLNKPYMVKINSWRFFDEDLVYLMDRNQNQHINRNYRDLCWYTKNEFEYLLNYAKPEIEAVYVGQQWKNFDVLPDYLGEMEDYSVSCQLYWANWWFSFSKICRHPYTRQRLPISPEMSWLNAEQRLRLLNYALKFHEEDFVVESYGENHISIWCNDKEIESAKNIALDLGLILPANLLPSYDFFEERVDLNPMLSFDKQVKQHLYFNSILIKENIWLDVDYLVLPEFEKKAATILKEASQNLVKIKNIFNKNQKTIYDAWLSQQARTAVDYVKKRKSE